MRRFRTESREEYATMNLSLSVWPRALALLSVVFPAAVQAADWQPVTKELILAEKPGFGKLCGVAVDPLTGDVIVNLSDKGFYRSTDLGKTWRRLGTQTIKGRTETPGCLMLDPTGKTKTIVVGLVYGEPILTSTDKGETWKTMDKKSGHVDWFAIDWTDPERKFVLTLKHESGGLLLASRDGGKTFDEIGKGHGPAWVFDDRTAVVAEEKTKARPKPNLLRTTDGGKTFQPCGEYSTKALPKWHEGTLYWVVEGAILTTTDKGASWKKLCDFKDGRYGPVFGKTAKHLFVLTGAGVVESSDGGATWSKPMDPPIEFKGVSPLSWIAYDPVHDVVYLMKMGSELYRMQRGK
jgi:hypothetical protein